MLNCTSANYRLLDQIPSDNTMAYTSMVAMYISLLVHYPYTAPTHAHALSHQACTRSAIFQLTRACMDQGLLTYYMDWKPAKICVVSHELFMIAMVASELDETNGEDRGARECTPLTPEFCLSLGMEALSLIKGDHIVVTSLRGSTMLLIIDAMTKASLLTSIPYW